MRDPVIYRIRHAEHHRTGGTWCIYPMYDYTHCISDALENITHSICTLEFEDHRPLYDWVLAKLADFGALLRPLPQQIEFARLNMTYTVLSKRKLIQLVAEGHVAGWDDPRMPTIVGFRRRGYTPEAIRLFAERIGVSKADSVIDMSVLEDCLREDLNARAPRGIAVLDPLKLVIDNYPEGKFEQCEAPTHPQKPELGRRTLPFGRELWIERDDFEESPPKGYFRLYPGNQVRLRYGYVVKCLGCDKDEHGNVIAVRCHYFPDSKSGSPGANNYKVKGNIHWVSVAHAAAAEVRLYDRLFLVPFPGSQKGAHSVKQALAAAEHSATTHDADKPDAAQVKDDHNFLDDINPESTRIVTGYLEPGLRDARPRERFQFERHGYFVADSKESQPGKPVFNRAVTLKDSWGKGETR
jgi:glutaminyl-tRNA synthetase